MSAGIRIKGVRIDAVTVTRKDDGLEFTAGYSLMTMNGTVLAKQQLNGYETLKLPLSPAMAKAIRTMSDVLKDEIETIIGLKEEEATNVE